MRLGGQRHLLVLLLTFSCFAARSRYVSTIRASSSRSDAAGNIYASSSAGKLFDTPDGTDHTCGSWLSAYKDIHNRGVRRLKAGKKVQMVVYTCHSGCGGLGDRLSGMLSAFYVAVVTGRVFAIDHTSPSPLTTTLTSNSIDWDLTAFIHLGAKSKTIHLMDTNNPMGSFLDIMKAHLSGVQILRLQLNRYFVAMALWTPKQLLQTPSGGKNEFIGELYEAHMRFCSSPLRTKATFHVAFHFLFNFSGAVLSRAEDMYHEIGFARVEEFIGLHARLGGEVTGESNVVPWQDPKRHAIDDLPKFLSCARSKSFGRWKADTGEMRILIISDSLAFKEASEGIPGTAYVKSTKLFHVDRSSSVDESVILQGSIDTYAELLLLSRAKCIVGSRSGFSGVAAAISNTVHDEQRCFCMFDDCDNDDFDYFETSDRSQVSFA